MSVTVAIPATTNGAGDILYATISSRGTGNGSFWLENIIEVTEMNKASIRNARTAAEWFAGRTFTNDVAITINPQRQSLTGRSWELMLSLGIISSLSGISMKPDMTGSARIGVNGILLPVGSLEQKLEAANAARFKTFLMSNDQVVGGKIVDMNIKSVNDIMVAWSIAALENSLKLQNCLF